MTTRKTSVPARVLAMTFAASLFWAPAVHAEIRYPRRQIIPSPGKVYEVKVTPPDAAHIQSGKSKGVLRQGGRPKEETLQFEFADVPLNVFVSDHGNIVTVFSWPAAISLVVYGPDAKVLRSYSADDLLTGEERAYADSREKGAGPGLTAFNGDPAEFAAFRKYYGELGARSGKSRKLFRLFHPPPESSAFNPPKYGFSPDGSEFILETGWGKKLRFDLGTGALDSR